MKLTLISHASVIIETGDARVWTDPWLFGTAFNDSWTLCPPAAWDPSLLETIGFLWISHEHPDHFHLPTLRSLPQAFKQRVAVLFQRGGSNQLPARLGELGFRNLVELHHRQRQSLGGATWAYCYREGPLNACLAVGDGSSIVLDVNDAGLGSHDCALLRRDLGEVTALLTQFSPGGFGGDADRERRLPALARACLESVSEIHRRLRAQATVPIASFIRFAQADNAYMNRYANGVGAVAELLSKRGQVAVILAPGESWQVGEPHDSRASIERLERARSSGLAEPPLQAPTVSLDQIREACLALAAELRRAYPAVLLGLLRPVRVAIPDLQTTVVFSLANGRFEEAAAQLAPDVEIRSQPLHFLFAHSFGMQTLGVSARLRVLANRSNWNRHRVLLSLHQANLHLGSWRQELPRLPDNLRHLVRRLRSME